MGLINTNKRISDMLRATKKETKSANSPEYLTKEDIKELISKCDSYKALKEQISKL